MLFAHLKMHCYCVLVGILWKPLSEHKVLLFPYIKKCKSFQNISCALLSEAVVPFPMTSFAAFKAVHLP